MNLTKNAHIYTSDGQDIGNLNRFVMDPRTKRVTHIVFEHGMLPKTEYVIAMYLVDHVDDAGIHLKDLPSNEISALDRFEQKSYIMTDERALLDRGYASDQTIENYYYYPPAPYGASGILRPDDMYIQQPPDRALTNADPGIPVSGDKPVQPTHRQNIPEGTVALKEGAKVVSSDVKDLGQVEKIFVDPGDEQATHFMITKGLINQQKKVIPMEWVTEISESQVLLAVDEALVNRLPDYQGEDPA